MKKILYLCFMTCCIFNITTKAQILGDNNWESNAHFEDNFTVNNRTWRSDFKDLPLLKWMAFSFDSGVTHGTGEHQVYQKQNCIFDDTNNTMRLVATYEGGSLQCIDSNSPYYYVVPSGYQCHTDYNSLYYFSGEIDVLNYIYPNPNPQFLYGYFEIKCQLPVHMGAFPAFWLWGGGNPHYEEIDIFEYSWRFTDPVHNENTPGLGSSRVFTTGFYFNDTKNEVGWQYSFARNYPEVPTGSNGLSDWHTFSCEWSPNRLVWYFDGEIVNEYYADNVPYRPMALKTNFALDNYVLDDDELPITLYFPSEMTIEYIKVHKLKCDCDDAASIPNNAALSTYDFEVKESITIGSSGNDVNIPASSKVVLRATDYIEITNDFEVPNGSELELIIHPCPE